MLAIKCLKDESLQELEKKVNVILQGIPEKDVVKIDVTATKYQAIAVIIYRVGE